MIVRYLLGLIIFSFLNGLSFADELSRSRLELQALQEKITTLQKNLDDDREAESSITLELDQIEKELSRLHRSIRKQQKVKANLEQQIVSLKKRASRLEVKNSDALGALAKLIKSAYAMGRQSGLRLLVNQQDPDLSARRMTMFRYIMQARNKQLNEIIASTRALTETADQLATQQANLDKTLESLAANQQQLQSQEEARTSALANIRSILADAESKVSFYKEKEKSLNKLLAELTRPVLQLAKQAKATDKAKAESSEPASQSVISVQSASSESTTAIVKPPVLKGFSRRRGKLKKPVDASIAASFGDRKPESGLRWEGLLFNSASGQPVTVVHHGQVVFSDWFRGYGQLMVVDHGDGYMSLYGNNQQLQATVGDTVDSGQVIALSNDVENLPSPGLYFEIRHNGNPDDPLKWVR